MISIRAVKIYLKMKALEMSALPLKLATKEGVKISESKELREAVAMYLDGVQELVKEIEKI